MSETGYRPENSSPVLAERSREGEHTLHFTVWAVLARTEVREHSEADASAFEAAAGELADGVTLRGVYDVSGMREDADLMLWLHGSSFESLQAALRTLRRTELLAGTDLAFSFFGVHREAEFSKDHSPAFARGTEAGEWLTVYPFVRSYDWYMLDAKERGKMLRDHGILGRDFPTVQANTVASFALGDWEWIIALEAPEVIDLVDMMRHLRYTEARNHVREEVPFYTGRRISALEAVEVLA
ncbi:chlorite dismutase [Galactobacter valiniphilus]|uniref:Coproheme decarboxylase n=1 Tax=Galactobacter valiniphilus TaxID=2676122 RepID=A0A399JBK6_9MICC|nr:hydrogen peroxide-dependent heme synthase [Galactobacter valiniphilus]RII42604.1 chlorite dismutase [Galactobacter valiniphilus]